MTRRSRTLFIALKMGLIFRQVTKLSLSRKIRFCCQIKMPAKFCSQIIVWKRVVIQGRRLKRRTLCLPKVKTLPQFYTAHLKIKVSWSFNQFMMSRTEMGYLGQFHLPSYIPAIWGKAWLKMTLIGQAQTIEIVHKVQNKHQEVVS